MSVLQLTPVPKNQPPQADTIHFSSKRFRIAKLITRYTKRFSGRINIIKFIDKDTKQIVLYAPALQLSAYGETDDKAFEMMKEAMSCLFDSYVEMKMDELNAELTRLGWKKDKLRNKDFSRAFIDQDGALKNFNAIDNTVEHLAVVAA